MTSLPDNIQPEFSLGHAELFRIYEIALAHAGVGVSITTPGGQMIYASDSLAHLLGYSSPLAIAGEGISLLDFIAEADTRAELSTMMGENAATKRTVQLLVGPQRDELRYVEISLTPTTLSGSVTFLVTLADLTAQHLAEVARRESEGQFMALAETMPVGTVMYSRAGIMFANQAIFSISGYDWEELQAMDFTLVFHPDDRQLVRERIATRIAGDDAPQPMLEVRIITKSGETRWIQLIGSSMEQSGQPVGIGMAIDITERKQMEANMARLERIRRVLSESQRAVLTATGESSFLRRLCRLIERVGHYEMAWVALTIPSAEEQPQLILAAQSGDVTQYAAAVQIDWTTQTHGPIQEAVLTQRTCVVHDIAAEDGIAWRLSALARGYRAACSIPIIESTGAVLGVLTIYADSPGVFDEEEVELLEGIADAAAHGISTLRHERTRIAAEQELSRSESRFRLLFEQIPSAAALHEVITDDDGRPVDYRYLAANVQFGPFSGLANSQQVVGQTITQLSAELAQETIIGPNRQETTWPELFGRIALEQIEPLIGAEIHSSTLQRWFRITAFSPQYGQFVVIFDDITAEISRREELAAVRHDIRNPLTSLALALRTLVTKVERDTLDPASLSKLVHRAEQLSRTVTEIAEDMLTTDRILQGSREVEIQAIPVQQVLQEFAALCLPIVINAGCELETQAVSADLQMHTHLHILQRILFNLISNATKYSPQGGHIRLSAHTETIEGRNYVAIVVSDTGIGISPAGIIEVTEAQHAHRTQGAVASGIEGTGVGWQSIKTYLRIIGGRFRIESEEGRGTTVTILIPRA